MGCGTGRWGLELAVKFPKAQVVGFDLEEVERPASAPLNYHFQRGNLLDGLPFVAQSFQYVHQRLLVAAIPLNRWPFVLGELKRVTAPAGWVELVEMGTGFHRMGPAMQQLLTWGITLTRTKGIEGAQMVYLGDWLKQAGFVQIKSDTKVLPVGTWGGRIGSLLAQDLLAGWTALRPLAQTELGVAPERFNAALQALGEEWNRCQTTYEVYFACGQVER